MFTNKFGSMSMIIEIDNLRYNIVSHDGKLIVVVYFIYAPLPFIYIYIYKVK